MEPTNELVPWIATWSGERRMGSIAPVVDGRGRLHPDLSRSAGVDLLEGRPWIRPDGQFVGDPLFAYTSSWRQAMCMVERRCQVCGDVIDGPGLFLLTGQHRADWERTKETIVPPVHPEPCGEIALWWCPHLKRVRALRLVGFPEPRQWIAESLDRLRPGAVALPWSSRSKRYLGRNVSVGLREVVDVSGEEVRPMDRALTQGDWPDRLHLEELARKARDRVE